MTETEPVWVDAQGGYRLALIEGKLRCQNAKGKTLSAVPAKVKKGDEAERLLALRDWLVAHERECIDTVERAMLRSLPLPFDVLKAVFSDPAWRAPLVDTVVVCVDGAGTLLPDEAGFLRAIDPERGVGVVTLDGETQWLQAERVAVPHPILLDEREDYRELATELGITQGIPQLFRETFERPAAAPRRAGDPKAAASRVTEFADGKFLQLNHVLGKCRTLGYRVRGGFAGCVVYEGSNVAEARYWIGAEGPEYETYTGDLVWVDADERTLPLADVGPVAYSEGMRMASAIYAARHIEPEGEAS